MSSCSSPLSPSPANFSTLLVRQRFAASDRRLSPERLLLGQNKHPGPTRRIRTTKPEPNISMSITVAISLTQLREASVKASLCPCAPDRSLEPTKGRPGVCRAYSQPTGRRSWQERRGGGLLRPIRAFCAGLKRDGFFFLLLPASFLWQSERGFGESLDLGLRLFCFLLCRRGASPINPSSFLLPIVDLSSVLQSNRTQQRHRTLSNLHLSSART